MFCSFAAAADSGACCPALFSTHSPNSLGINHRLSPSPPTLPGEDAQPGLGQPQLPPKQEFCLSFSVFSSSTGILCSEKPPVPPTLSWHHLVLLCTMTCFLWGLFAFFSQTRERQRNTLFALGVNHPPLRHADFISWGAFVWQVRGRLSFQFGFGFFPRDGFLTASAEMMKGFRGLLILTAIIR